MTSSRESTPCPSRSKGPQDERMLTDDEPAGPDDFPRTKEEFRKRCAEMMSGLKKHLTETHRLVAQLKKLHHQTAQQKLKVVSASVLNEQPKVWKASTSASYKRHSRLSENKKVRRESFMMPTSSFAVVCLLKDHSFYPHAYWHYIHSSRSLFPVEPFPREEGWWSGQST